MNAAMMQVDSKAKRQRFEHMYDKVYLRLRADLFFILSINIGAPDVLAVCTCASMGIVGWQGWVEKEGGCVVGR